MWRYQRPGFEALLLAELQRQQRCRQFCDTVLRADGVSVPAHSCILFTLSPQLSCALSTSPAPPSGQSHLLDFQAFGACTLVRLVGLLYSGEMVGEAERQEGISAAPRLGIQGLVEVGKRDDKKEREVEDVVHQSRRRTGPSLVEEKRLMEWVSQRNVGVQTDRIVKRTVCTAEQ
ncbi:BTB/POZ domain-containing protein 18-like [Salvelinus sp. IW2-2015]|uniref:BTB/POZ domain-containing protein 18-like n=1 Tax=Salvelinus sp. IW2-2015 TaxID=2691554 RepID=UPI000CDFE9BF|nr:BTB/POZ domain-containing protein 18-like [Salvelinus alpinus]XP_023845811.1 BTB/POZ domain-containing protein 18-like [Salvelinus alpinus]